MTNREAITHGISQLKIAGIETSSLDASLLLSHILGITRTALAAKWTDTLCEQAFDAFNGLIERRLNGECVAYIFGKKEFFNMEFMVNKNVLVPRPDTEILVESALKILDRMNSGNVVPNAKPFNVLDLCTGSGIIAISLKHTMPALNVCACDISEQALTIAQINVNNLLPQGCKINFYNGDLFQAVPKSRLPFSLIAGNPPYVPSGVIKTLSPEVQNEPRIALDGGKSGLKIIRQIIEESPLYLEKSGALLLEAEPSQMEEITFMLEKRGFNNIELYKDLSGQMRVISGIYEKNN